MGIKNSHFKKDQIREVFTDYKPIFYLSISFLTGVISGGASNFGSALIKGSGSSGTETTSLQMPTGAIEFAFIFGAGVLAVLVKEVRCLIFCLLFILGLCGLIGIATIPLKKKWALVGCTWLEALVGCSIIHAWIFLNANVAGSTKRQLLMVFGLQFELLVV